jgi:hypothetical protein
MTKLLAHFLILMMSMATAKNITSLHAFASGL